MNRYVLVAALVLLGGEAFAQRNDEAPLVVVFTIEDQSGQMKAESLSQLTNYLIARLAEGGGYRVIPNSQVVARMREQKKGSYKDCYDQNCQIEVGRELAAQKSVATQILKVGSMCVVTTTLYDLKLAASEKSAVQKGGCGQDDLVASLEVVVGRLKGTQPARTSVPSTPAVTTPPPVRRPSTPAPPATVTPTRGCYPPCLYNYRCVSGRCMPAPTYRPKPVVTKTTPRTSRTASRASNSSGAPMQGGVGLLERYGLLLAINGGIGTAYSGVGIGAEVGYIWKYLGVSSFFNVSYFFGMFSPESSGLESGDTFGYGGGAKVFAGSFRHMAFARFAYSTLTATQISGKEKTMIKTWGPSVGAGYQYFGRRFHFAGDLGVGWYDDPYASSLSGVAGDSELTGLMFALNLSAGVHF